MLSFRSTSVLLIAVNLFIFANLLNAVTLPLQKFGNSSAQVVIQPSPTPKPPTQEPSPTPKETVAKTVQISMSVNADILIEQSDGKRLGFDFKSKKFVSEIPDARAITQENSATYVLPFDKSSKPYKVTICGKSASPLDADLSMTGPGFVVGFRNVPITSAQVQTLSIASNGLQLSFTANQNGPTPQLFLTTQSGRGKPSFRFEVSALTDVGKTITVELD